MKVSVLSLLVAGCAFGQAVYIEPPPALTVSGNPPSGSFPTVLAASGARVSLCSYPSCASLTQTYTDATAGTPCPTNAQVVIAGTSTCTNAADVRGNFGFWVLTGGQYQYKITLSNGLVYGPYPVTMQTNNAANVQMIGADGQPHTVQEFNAVAQGDSLIPTKQTGTGFVQRTARAKLNDTISIQDFGCVGDNVHDDTACTQAAFNYFRGNFPASTKGAFPDSRDGGQKLYIPRGIYRINGTVEVYAGVVVEGEASGSFIKSAFLQVDNTKPMFRLHPKNYAADNTVLNNSVGENVFRHMVFTGTQSGSGGEDANFKPLVQFMSPAESTAQFGIAGDGIGGNVGHIDTLFDDVWFQWGQTAVSIDEGAFLPVFRDCTFDVNAVAIEVKGTAHGKIRLFNDHFYWNTWGSVHVVTSGEMIVEAANSWFGSDGNVNLAELYASPIYFNSGSLSVGELHLSSCYFYWDNPQPGFRFGGHLYFKGRSFMMSDTKLMDMGGGGGGRPSHLYLSATTFQVQNNYFQSTSAPFYDGTTRMVIVDTAAFSPGIFANNVFQNDNASPYALFIDAPVKMNNATFADNRFEGARTKPITAYITDLPNFLVNNTGVDQQQSVGSAPPTDASYAFPHGAIRWNDGTVTPLTYGNPLGWVCSTATCLAGAGWLPFGLIYQNSGQVNVFGPLFASSGGNVPTFNNAITRTAHAVCWVSNTVQGHCSSSIAVDGSCTCVP